MVAKSFINLMNDLDKKDKRKLIIRIQASCEVSQSSVYNWIKGTIVPNTLIQERIAKILQLPKSQLFE